MSFAWLAGFAISAGAGGFTMGFESNSLFAEEMKLKSSPSISRVITNNLTSVTRTVNSNYFSEVYVSTGADLNYTAWNGSFLRKFALPVPSTMTTTRNWSVISQGAQYIFVKASYSTEHMEGIVKLGSATRRLARREQSSFTEAKQGVSSVETKDVLDTNLLDLPQGFAYGFEIRAQPYQTENFYVMTSIHFTQALNKNYAESFHSLRTSTANVTLGQTAVHRTIDLDTIRYGLSVAGAVNLGPVQPYLGISYADGRMKGTHRTAILDETYANGLVTEGTTTIETLEYILKPKVPISLMVGLTFPFDRGAVTIEGRVQGENVLSVSGFIGF